MTLRWAFERLSQPKRKFKMSNVSLVAGGEEGAGDSGVSN